MRTGAGTSGSTCRPPRCSTTCTQTGQAVDERAAWRRSRPVPPAVCLRGRDAHRHGRPAGLPGAGPAMPRACCGSSRRTCCSTCLWRALLEAPPLRAQRASQVESRETQAVALENPVRSAQRPRGVTTRRSHPEDRQADRERLSLEKSRSAPATMSKKGTATPRCLGSRHAEPIDRAARPLMMTGPLTAISA